MLFVGWCKAETEALYGAARCPSPEQSSSDAARSDAARARSAEDSRCAFVADELLAIAERYEEANSVERGGRVRALVDQGLVAPDTARTSPRLVHTLSFPGPHF